MAELYTNSARDLAGYENLTRFDGFFDNRYYDPMVSGYGFIFITKPELFIKPATVDSNDIGGNLAYRNMTKDPYFSQFLESEAFNESDVYIPKLLSYIKYNNVGGFMPMFTNKSKNIETSDITLENTESFDTKQGFRLPLPSHTTASEATSQITLSVTESSNMDFTKLISLWVKYISNITDGTFDANPEMIKNGIIDYMCSIYYIALEPDGRTIRYWTKYSGCWPTSIPYSAMRYNRGDAQLVELDIPFVYTVKEDMSPQILEDFNIVSLNLYDEIINQNVVSDSISGYQSISSNKLLTMSGLKTLYPNIETDETRPPIIVYNENENNKKFILSFGSSTNDARFIKSVLRGDATSVSNIGNGTVVRKDLLTNDDVDNYYFSISADDNFFL